jgi:hypothetical protein
MVMGNKTRLAALGALCVALFIGAPAFAAPTAPPSASASADLSTAQQDALIAEILKQARLAQAGARIAYTIPDQTGALIFSEEERTTNAGKESVCKYVIVEFTQPRRSPLRSRACTPLGNPAGYGGPKWSMAAGFTSAATAGPRAPEKPVHEEVDKSAKDVGSGGAAPSAETAPTRAIPRKVPADAPSPPPPAPSAPTTTTAANGGLERVVSAVLVEIPPAEPRYARHGGMGVVLLSEAPADKARNLALCRALFKSFDTATNAEVRTGQRETEDTIEELRPLYWPLKDLSKAATGEDKCAHRVARYDFTRAWKIRSKLGLTKAGPLLLVSRADETRAGLVDLTGASDQDVADLVRYFRDGFSQQANIWSPERHAPGAAKVALDSFLGRTIAIAALPKLVVVSALRVGCPLGDPMDVCTNPLPR